MVDPYLAAGLVVTALLAAMVGLLALAALLPRNARVAQGIFSAPAGATTFLFDGEVLVDATPGARALMAHSPLRGGTAWMRLVAWLQPRFPDLTEALARLPAEGRCTLAGCGDGAASLVLTAELRGGLTRLVLTDAAAGPDGAADTPEPLAERAMTDEIGALRRVVAAAPMPIWREDAAGDVIWGNAAYLDLALRYLPPGTELEWPLPRLFERVATAQGARGQRQRLAAGGAVQWFDLVGSEDGAGRLVFALPADGAVQAEVALHSFMQTLTKTFAHLRTGLAIFDQDRQLQLFNPALLDLTGLPPDLLTARPQLAAFFDAMRDRSMIPEPRDYRSWRRQMTEMEEAAASGLYEEVWNLPSGLAYRVTGRPHPNGALALMFEDISSEVTRTRRYHADVELGQAVIDAMDQAIAVFSQSGTLVMSNTAYAGMWGHDPGASLDGAVSAASLCDHWREGTAPTTLWDRAEDFIAALGPLEGWSDTVRLRDGRRITCRLTRLPGGATLVMFGDEAMGAALPRPDDGAPQFSTTRRSA